MDAHRVVAVDSALGAEAFTNAALSNTLVQVAPGISGRPRVVYAAVLSNPGSAVAYAQLFNAGSTATVTLGTTPATLAFYLAAGATLVLPLADVGVRFDAGLVIAATSTATGALAPTGGTLLADIIYA